MRQFVMLHYQCQQLQFQVYPAGPSLYGPHRTLNEPGITVLKDLDNGETPALNKAIYEVVWSGPKTHQ